MLIFCVLLNLVPLRLQDVSVLLRLGFNLFLSVPTPDSQTVDTSAYFFTAGALMSSRAY